MNKPKKAKRNNGGLAFPSMDGEWIQEGEKYILCLNATGMTLRQWYKAAALTAAVEAVKADHAYYADNEPQRHRPPMAAEIATVAAQIADALIAEDEE